MEYFASKLFAINILARFRRRQKSQPADSRYFSRIDLHFFLIWIAAFSEVRSRPLQSLLRIHRFFGRLAARHAPFAGGFREGFRSSDRAQHIKQRSVGWNLQVEIDSAVYQDAAQ